MQSVQNVFAVVQSPPSVVQSVSAAVQNVSASVQSIFKIVQNPCIIDENDSFYAGFGLSWQIKAPPQYAIRFKQKTMVNTRQRP